MGSRASQRQWEAGWWVQTDSLFWLIFQKQFRNRDVSPVLLHLHKYTFKIFLIGAFESERSMGALSKQCFFATIRPHRRFFLKKGKNFMISLWLKILVKRKLVLYSWKETANTHRHQRARGLCTSLCGDETEGSLAAPLMQHRRSS